MSPLTSPLVNVRLGPVNCMGWGGCAWDLAILERSLLWYMKPGPRVRAFRARANRRCHYPDTTFAISWPLDWWILGEIGTRCFVKNCEGSEPLPHFTEMSFMYVNTADFKTLAYEKSSLLIFTAKSTARVTLSHWFPISTPGGDAMKTDAMWVWVALCGFSS